MAMYEWNDGTDYLSHAWLKKGAQADKHKYVARVGNSPNYKYFYTNAEYQAYLRKEKVKKQFGNVGSNWRNKLAGIGNTVRNGVRTVGWQARTVGNRVSEVGSRVKEAVYSTVKPRASEVGSRIRSAVASSNVKSRISDASSRLKESASRMATASRNAITNAASEVSSGLRMAQKLIRAASSKSVESMAEEYAIERGSIISDYKSNVKKGFLFSGLLGGTAVAAVLTKKASDALTGLYDKFMKRQDEMIEQMDAPNPKSFNDVKKKSHEMSADEDMARVNPYYEEGDIFKINCSYCTLAYEMRRRGYDVEADDYWGGIKEDEANNVFEELYTWYTHNGENQDRDKAAVTRGLIFDAAYARNLAKYNGDKELARVMAIKESYERAYPGVQYYDTRLTFDGESAYSKIINDIKSQGDGARGQFLLYWKNGGGHSVVYEVENGEVYLRDCQTGKKIDPSEYYDLASEIMYFRTDNEEINENALNCVKNKQSDTVNNPKSAQEKMDAFIRSGYSVVRADNRSNAYYMKGPDGNYYKWDPRYGTFDEVTESEATIYNVYIFTNS